MKIEFLQVAQVELEEAVDYYNEQSEGLGYEFAADSRGRSAASSNTPMLGHCFQSAPVDAARAASHTASSTRSETTHF